MSDGNGGFGFIAGLFFGAALGAAGALLLAPKSGREFRDTLAGEGRRLRESTGSRVAEIREKGAELYGTTRQALTDTAAEVKEAARGVSEGPKKLSSSAETTE